MNAERGDTGPPDRPSAGDSERPLRIYTSGELFAGEKELIIVHARDHYRLRITRQDKLILTK